MKALLIVSLALFVLLAVLGIVALAHKTWLNRCRWGFHDEELKVEAREMFTRCCSCGWRSDGVSFDSPPLPKRTGSVQKRERLAA